MELSEQLVNNLLNWKLLQMEIYRNKKSWSYKIKIFKS